MTAIIDPLHIPSIRSQRVSRGQFSQPGPRASASAAARHRPTPAVYRRRRMMVGGALAVAVATVVTLALGTSAIANEPGVGNQAVPRAIVVQQGDTLWGIARRIAPTGNISNLVNELVRINGADLQVGQIIRVP
jgi:nucleoid-associated protein YgaU